MKGATLLCLTEKLPVLFTYIPAFPYPAVSKSNSLSFFFSFWNLSSFLHLSSHCLSSVPHHLPPGLLQCLLSGLPAFILAPNNPYVPKGIFHVFPLLDIFNCSFPSREEFKSLCMLHQTLYNLTSACLPQGLSFLKCSHSYLLCYNHCKFYIVP